MHQLVVFSYYQSPHLIPPKLESNERNVLNKVQSKDGELIVSNENLNLLDKTRKGQHLYSDVSDYFTALYCDMEVAMQEWVLNCLATMLGFEYQVKPSSFLPRSYNTSDLIAPSPEDLPALSDIVSGNIGVVNSHGTPGVIDGGYKHIFDSLMHGSLTYQRIVIDACSSAIGKKKKNKSDKDRSVMELFADDALKKKLPMDLEIVGYEREYDPKEIGLITRAVFVNKPGVGKDLLLFSLEERAIARKKQDDIILNKRTDSKLRFFSNGGSKIDILRSIFIAACSFICNTFLGRVDIKNPALAFLMEMTGSPKKNSEELVKLGFDSKKSVSKKLKEFSQKLKEERKQYISTLDQDKLINNVIRGLAVFQPYKDKENNEFLSFLRALEDALNFVMPVDAATSGGSVVWDGAVASDGPVVSGGAAASDGPVVSRGAVVSDDQLFRMPQRL